LYLSIVPTEPKADLYSKDRWYLSLVENAEKECKILQISSGPAKFPLSILCQGKKLAKIRNFLMEGMHSLID